MVDGKPTRTNPAREQNPVTKEVVGDGVFTHFCFDRPWPHEVRVTMGTRYNEEHNTSTLGHVIEVKNLSSEPIPISLAFHPYIATHGQPFVIRNRGRVIRSEDVVPGEAEFIGRHISDHSYIELSTGTLEIAMDRFNDVCLWSDDVSRYICFEPVYRNANDTPAMLAAGASVKTTCYMHFTAKA